jgi:hypothetical protein
VNAACGKWIVKRTGEESPDYQYRVVRKNGDGYEVYGYTDSRDEAKAIAAEANETAGRP